MLEGCNAEQIHDRLAHVYGDDAFVQSTVHKWRREFRLGRKAVEDLSRVTKLCLDDIDGAIFQKLNRHLFIPAVLWQRRFALRLPLFGNI
jgi:hypothetical protein